MQANSGSLRVNRVDLLTRQIMAGEIVWAHGRITAWQASGPLNPALPYLLPGFIDAHVHIESSMLPPSEFARIALRHGTVATISDPHEIANVLGVDGVRWMLDNAALVPFHFLFGAPSCVPATGFETAGAQLDAEAVGQLLDTPGVGYLSEVMNVPGVLAGDVDLQAKIAAAQARGRPVDGHAPGLSGPGVAAYAASGITTDHECTNLVEAKAKLRSGMRILLREGSAARDFAALHPLISEYPGLVMFCTDDFHPDDLQSGHINRLVARAVAAGHDVFDVLEAACMVPQRHYGLNLGSLQEGDAFNAVLVSDLTQFAVQATWIDGRLLAEGGRSLLPFLPVRPINRFAAEAMDTAALSLRVGLPDGVYPCRVIEAADGELLTREGRAEVCCRAGYLQPDPADDLLLLAVVNRYHPAPPALALVRGFGLQRGAMASSVAHDSHNLIAVGCDAVVLAEVLNALVATQGGLALSDGEMVQTLPLPIAGLMSASDGDTVAASYAALTSAAREMLGSPMRAPFMTLAFMALLVIPELKLCDRGLFDGRSFGFVETLVAA